MSSPAKKSFPIKKALLLSSGIALIGLLITLYSCHGLVSLQKTAMFSLIVMTISFFISLLHFLRSTTPESSNNMVETEEALEPSLFSETKSAKIALIVAPLLSLLAVLIFLGSFTIKGKLLGFLFFFVITFFLLFTLFSGKFNHSNNNLDVDFDRSYIDRNRSVISDPFNPISPYYIARSDRFY